VTEKYSSKSSKPFTLRLPYFANIPRREGEERKVEGRRRRKREREKRREE
jgi:hypothetical protein